MRALTFIALWPVAALALSSPVPSPRWGEAVNGVNWERGADWNRAARPKGTAMRFDPKSPEREFSFLYGGLSSADLLPKWKRTSASRRLDAERRQLTWTWADPETGLQVRCEGIEYSDFAAIEWTLHLKNTGAKDTPILENIQALDMRLERGQAGEFLLHHNVGSPNSKSDYGPLETPLGPNAVKRIGGAGGRPTNSDMSYFNLAHDGGGTLVVVGWPGQWSAEFKRDAAKGLRISAGQELTHFKLHPGEEVRSPLIVLQSYKGDWIDGQNQWRRWMMAHGMPKPGGKLPRPMFLASSGRAYQEMIGANEANQIMHIDRYLELGLKIDYWWMDAGWYIQKQGWPQVGTWEVDPARFPNGFKPISDHAHAKGVKILVWFEPERVAPDTWLANNHPEWLISPSGSLLVRRSSELQGSEPCVVFNNSSMETRLMGIVWPPMSLSFHPGPKGEYSVVRFTAPKAGSYNVDAEFAALDQRPTTTDVHVLKGGQSVFDGFINLNGHGGRAEALRTVDLGAGETLDFVVGYGNGEYVYDSTGIRATVTGPDGKAHDAAKEFAEDRDPNGLWSYGWLPAGPSPLASRFSPYGKAAKAGDSGNKLLNLGNPDAWKWLVEHVDKLIVDSGIDLYRQDFNFDPLNFWRAADAPDRQGITEIKHITGYLAYWDELRRRHPNMLIDSCASGGRRNDLETMRRAVPLWRSDYAYEPIGHQCMTYGISLWLPFHGTGTVATVGAPYYGGGFTPVEPYAFWSNTAPSLGSGVDVREVGIDYGALRRLFGEWRDISQFYYGDFYPLTPYSQADDAWIAWQYNRPESGDGVVQVFRRQKAGEETARLKLRGLNAKATYTITAVDGVTLERTRWSGEELMKTGLPVTLKDRPAAAVVRYAKTR